MKKKLPSTMIVKPRAARVRENMVIILTILFVIVVVSSLAFMLLLLRLSAEEADFWLRPMTFALSFFTLLAVGGALFTGHIVLRSLKVEVSAAQTEASNAKARADQEAIKRLELEKYIQPREIPPREWARLIGRPDPVKPLIPFSGITAIISTLEDSEPIRAALNIEGTLKAAKWTVKGGPLPPGRVWDGVRIDKATGRTREGDNAPKASEALIGVLKSYNWKDVGYNNVSPDKLPINTVRITIGFNSVTGYFWPKTLDELGRVTIEYPNEKKSPK